jgi:glucokinase
MSYDVRMDYAEVEELIRAYLNAVDQLGQTTETIQKIATTLEDGALVSAKGQQWVDLLRGRLMIKLVRVINDLAETSHDIHGALRELRDGDVEARGRFGG